MHIDTFWSSVTSKFRDTDQRWGQAMYNTLFELGVDTEPITGTLDDPFYRVKTRSSAIQWFDRHVIVDDSGTIVGTKEYNV